MKTLATALILGLIVLAFYQYGQNQKQAKDISTLQNQIAKMGRDAAEERAATANADKALWLLV